jgi:hypothetical protein
MKLSGGGLAFQDKGHPTSVYLAYPGSNYQVEVFDPSAARARQVVLSGRVAPVAAAATAKPDSKAASVSNLKSLAVTLGHPIYWAGAEPKVTYELTKTKSGRVYIRYLPAGVKVGSPRPDYLTVGTYPQQDAFAALEAAAAKNGAMTIKLAGGGLASIDPKHPTSVYLASPKADVQVEVYSPNAARARKLVSSGAITPVG